MLAGNGRARVHGAPRRRADRRGAAGAFQGVAGRGGARALVGSGSRPPGRRAGLRRPRVRRRPRPPSGAADAGLAVRAVADSLGLDWIPVATEWFELALPRTSRAAIEPLLDVLASTSVHGRLAALTGYDLEMTGELREAA